MFCCPLLTSAWDIPMLRWRVGEVCVSKQAFLLMDMHSDRLSGYSGVRVSSLGCQFRVLPAQWVTEKWLCPGTGVSVCRDVKFYLFALAMIGLFAARLFPWDDSLLDNWVECFKKSYCLQKLPFTNSRDVWFLRVGASKRRSVRGNDIWLFGFEPQLVR